MQHTRLDPTKYPDFYRSGGYGFLPQVLLDRFREQVGRQIRTAIHERETHLREATDNLAQADDKYDAYRDVFYYKARRDEECELHELLQELTILSAYRYIEVAVSTRVAEHFPHLDLRQLHRSQYAQRQLPFLKTLVGAAAVDESRLLNYCIKHSGRVSRELARRYPTWRVGEPLSGLDAAYERIAPFIGAYWVDFVQSISEFANAQRHDT